MPIPLLTNLPAIARLHNPHGPEKYLLTCQKCASTVTYVGPLDQKPQRCSGPSRHHEWWRPDPDQVQAIPAAEYATWE